MTIGPYAKEVKGSPSLSNLSPDFVIALSTAKFRTKSGGVHLAPGTGGGFLQMITVALALSPTPSKF